MIKILIFSNTRSEELSTFIQQRGTFQVEGCYTSISENVQDIQNRILEVDKTLYLYQPDDGVTNIRSDMQVLQTMLQTNSFFKPGEIAFVTRSTYRQAEKYFVTVMKNCNYKNYSVKIMDESISFSAVYDNLMGISTNEDFKNSFSVLYRKERGVESSVAYEAQDDRDLRIEPFNFNGLKDYEGRKEITREMTSSIEFRDASDAELVQYDKLKLQGVNAMNVLGGMHTVMLTGKPKSGLSTWATALGVSARKAGKRVLVLDYTPNSDVTEHLKNDGIEYTERRMKEILECRGDAEGLQVCTYRNDAEFNARFDFLNVLFCGVLHDYDELLLPVCWTDFDRAYRTLHTEIKKVLFTVVPRYSDVEELLGWVDLLAGMEVLTLMNECVQVREGEFLSRNQVKEMLSLFNTKVAKHCYFGSLNVGTNLYRALLEERGEAQND